MKSKLILAVVLSLGLFLTLSRSLADLSHVAQAWSPALQGGVSLHAAAGTGFTYQGRLTDGGNPTNATYDFEFKLYDAATSGGLIGMVTLADITVSDGLFSVVLDFGSGAFNGEARWLEVGVRPGSNTDAYTALTPRQAITPAPYALALPGLRTEQNVASPNVIGGYSGNSVAGGVGGATIGGGGFSGSENQAPANYAVVGGGASNTAYGDYATVDGGSANLAGAYATVGGGFSNNASGAAATVGGGDQNVAAGANGTIGGGSRNTADGDFATIAGGGPADLDFPDTTNNRVTDGYGAIGGGGANRAGDGDGDRTNATFATVGGGARNTAGGEYATVGGGDQNIADGENATIAGGVGNAASGYAASVGGGLDNEVTADFATIAGGGRTDVTDPNTGNSVTDNHGTIGGGGENLAGNDDEDQTNATSATVGGGARNTASGSSATVGGGWNNLATGSSSTIGGGSSNEAVGSVATVGGGYDNHATGASATVGGGSSNTANDAAATVGGGFNSVATGNSSTVAGGSHNSASGDFATVPGGQSNSAIGDWSLAAGRQAAASHQGAFVWADSTDAPFTSGKADEFAVRAAGGVQFFGSEFTIHDRAGQIVFRVDETGTKELSLDFFEWSRNVTGSYSATDLLGDFNFCVLSKVSTHGDDSECWVYLQDGLWYLYTSHNDGGACWVRCF
ncbi:MAG: hypothetical protein ACE5HA_01190 [Anaerolineae bacterium]